MLDRKLHLSTKYPILEKNLFPGLALVELKANFLLDIHNAKKLLCPLDF
jgi:hypothetical protein